MERIVSKLVLLAIVTTLLLGLSACAKNYKIGEMGPAGGLIFFDKGEKTDGWRYLEAAPVMSEFKAKWGYYEIEVTGTDTGIGSGKKNTEIIAAMGDVNSAAYKCRQLDIKGYKDWFLPSKDELDFMYRALHRQNMGFFKDDWYWSSSVGGDARYYTWVQKFSDGYQLVNISNGRYRELSVRGVLAF